MGRVFGSKSVEAHLHLQRLYTYQMSIEAKPQICDRGVAPAALDWLAGRIAELDMVLFPANEKAALPGDSFGNQNQFSSAIIIPEAVYPDKKGVVVHA